MVRSPSVRAPFSLPLVPAIKTGWTLPPEEIMKTPGYRRPKD